MFTLDALCIDAPRHAYNLAESSGICTPAALCIGAVRRACKMRMSLHVDTSIGQFPALLTPGDDACSAFVFVLRHVLTMTNDHDKLL